MARGGKKKGRSLRRGHDAGGRNAARRTRLREIAGVGFLALTVAAIIALASYSAQDPSFNVATGSDRVHNHLGVFGSHLADLLVQLFGFGAWLFPVFAFGAAVLSFTGFAGSALSRLGRIAGLTGFSVSLIVLGNLAFPGTDPFYGGGAPSIPGGGVAGRFLAGLALPWLSVAGTVLVFGFLLIASLTLATHVTPRAVARGAWAGGLQIGKALSRA